MSKFFLIINTHIIGNTLSKSYAIKKYSNRELYIIFGDCLKCSNLKVSLVSSLHPKVAQVLIVIAGGQTGGVRHSTATVVSRGRYSINSIAKRHHAAGDGVGSTGRRAVVGVVRVAVVWVAVVRVAVVWVAVVGVGVVGVGIGVG